MEHGIILHLEDNAGRSLTGSWCILIPYVSNDLHKLQVGGSSIYLLPTLRGPK